MQNYRVILSVSGKSLPTLLGVIERANGITLTALELNGGNVAEPSTTEARQVRYAGGKRNKGISGRDLVLKVIRESSKPTPYTVVRDAMVKQGFADNSASPLLSRLRIEGLISRNDNDTYQATKAK
jgi:hypothetical protein